MKEIAPLVPANYRENGSLFKPVRIKRWRQLKGWTMQGASPNGLTVKYIGRGTRWGNPFRHWLYDEDADVGDVLEKYDDWYRNLSENRRLWLLKPLIGLNLACWCYECDPCHGDWLLNGAWSLQLERAGYRNDKIK